MIPSDHFVRFYNEVFKALEARGHECLVAYWRELGRLQSAELADRFRAGGLKAALEYWKRIVIEENCEASIEDHGDYFEFHMIRCPSLSKVLDNDASPQQVLLRPLHGLGRTGHGGLRPLWRHGHRVAD